MTEKTLSLKYFSKRISWFPSIHAHVFENKVQKILFTDSATLNLK